MSGGGGGGSRSGGKAQRSGSAEPQRQQTFQLPANEQERADRAAERAWLKEQAQLDKDRRAHETRAAELRIEELKAQRELAVARGGGEDAVELKARKAAADFYQQPRLESTDGGASEYRDKLASWSRVLSGRFTFTGTRTWDMEIKVACCFGGEPPSRDAELNPEVGPGPAA